MLEIKKIRF